MSLVRLAIGSRLCASCAQSTLPLALSTTTPACARTPRMRTRAACAADSGRSGVAGGGPEPPVRGSRGDRAGDHARRAIGQRPQPVGHEPAAGREHGDEQERDRRGRRQAHGRQPPAAASAAAGLEAVQRWSRRAVHFPPRTIAPMSANPLRQLPSVDALLSEARRPPSPVTAARPPWRPSGRRSPKPAPPREPRSPESLLQRAAELLERPPSLRPVLNATGVIVHTNLGRAPLAAAALERVRAVAGGYSNLELDLGRGRAAARARTHVGALLRRADRRRGGDWR